MKHYYFLLLPIFLLLILPSYSQEALGPNPPSLKWRQFDTPAGKFIYPKGLDSLALRVAGLTHAMRLRDTSVIGAGYARKVPTILQPLSTLPAGFSTPAPWRNELFLTPPQNSFLGPVPWLDLLTIHEYRHAQQFHMGNQGFTRIYQVLMGQTGWLLNSLMSKPLWYREGDAVVTETIYSKGGRGRLPSFNMEYRAVRLAGRKYSYEKGNWFSYRDYVPNPYRSGYYMVNKLRRDHGPDIWQRILDDTYRRKGFFYPFSRAMKSLTGYSTPKLYEATMTELDTIFQAQDQALVLREGTTISANSEGTFTQYRFPHYLGSGGLIAEKSAFDEISGFWEIGKGNAEKKVFTRGIYTTDHEGMMVAGDLMTWAESAFDPRWANRDYSVIKTYHLPTGKKRQVTHKSRLFSPAPSYDGQFIAALEIDLQYRYHLVILDATTGEVIRQLPNAPNDFFSQLRWTEDGDHLICITTNTKGNALTKIDAQNGQQEILIDYTDVPLSRPFAKGDTVYYSAGYSGINNIYAINTATQRHFQLTSTRFGAFDPAVSPDGKRLAYSNFTADGYEVKEIALEASNWAVFDTPPPSNITFHHTSLAQEGEDLSQTVAIDSFKSRKFHALTHGLFKLYGWFPLPNYPELGAEFYTRNIMSSLTGTIGGIYNTNEQAFRGYTRFSYAGLYPIIELEGSMGEKQQKTLAFQQGLEEPILFDQALQEKMLSIGARFPFNLTQGSHRAGLEIGGAYQLFELDYLDTLGQKIGTQRFPALEANIGFSRLRATARRHVQPRWGQIVTANYRRSLDDDGSEMLLAAARLYFPGIAKNHSLNVSAAYQQESIIDAYRFVNRFQRARGYAAAPFEDLYRLSGNYELPIAYPDWSMGSVMFLQRIRSNFFFDYAKGTFAKHSETMRSAGVELMMDFRLFRLFQVNGGLQYAYLLDEPDATKRHFFNVIFAQFEFAN